MSVRIMSMVFENQILSSTQKLVMLALADHANDEGKSIYPSQSTVSRKTGLARGTVNRHIKELIDDGYLWSKGYKSERSNVLELEIVVKRLAEGIGVTESDTPDIGVKDGELQQVSPTVTTGVTHGNTKHQLTINKPSLKDYTPQREPRTDTHSLMVKALMEVTKMDMKIKSNAGRIVRASKELREAEFTDEDVLQFGKDWKKDWRYRRDKSPPSLTTLLSSIKKIINYEEQREREREIAQAAWDAAE